MLLINIYLYNLIYIAFTHHIYVCMYVYKYKYIWKFSEFGVVLNTWRNPMILEAKAERC